MKKIVLLSLFILLFIPSFVDAKTLNDYYNELAKLQAEYNANKNNKNLTEKQMTQLKADINSINNSITSIRKDIKKAEADINESNKISDDLKPFFS